MTRWDRLLPLLVYLQAHLEEDLSLAALSRQAGLSPSHLHQLFKAVVGETPKAYVARLRLERSAFRLLIHDTSLLDIALDCGFRNPETFSRAFKRRFGQPPSAYRDWVQAQRPRATREPVPAAPAEQVYALSATRVTQVREAHLAFIRHVGPYDTVPLSLFTELEAWAARRQLPGPHVWMGIGHDAPVSTPPDKLRFDAALMLSGPVKAEGRVGYQVLPAGAYAVTTYVGPMDRLSSAYADIFPRVTAIAGYNLIGLPAVEIYHSGALSGAPGVFQADLCLPVVRRP